ncbi:molecular chaperone [Bacillus subtilis subsp. subtilis]|nr:molecular chaperone [Bacillus subtilis subsp. subtilis]
MPMTARARRWRRRVLACTLISVASAVAHAASLQVAPTSLQLSARQNADALWISNSGTAPVQVQVRVYRWSQSDGQDRLEPTDDLQVSPPMQSLAAGQQQLVRVVRSDPQPPAAQLAYRVIVDELPALDPHRTGMQFVLRYSLPVFVQPGDTGTAQLQARQILLADGRPALEVRNSGRAYAQLADLAIGSAERPQTVHPGLLGYVLGGQTMHWPLDVPPARLTGATFMARINGESAQTPLPVAPPAR